MAGSSIIGAAAESQPESETSSLRSGSKRRKSEQGEPASIDSKMLAEALRKEGSRHEFPAYKKVTVKQVRPVCPN